MSWSINLQDIEGLSDNAKKGIKILMAKKTLSDKEKNEAINLIRHDSNGRLTQNPADRYLLSLIQLELVFSDKSFYKIFKEDYDDYYPHPSDRLEIPWGYIEITPDHPLYMRIPCYDENFLFGNFYVRTVNSYHRFDEEELTDDDIFTGDILTTTQLIDSQLENWRKRPSYTEYLNDSAINHLNFAAENGYNPAYTALGFAWARNRDKENSKTNALKFYNKAVELGDREAYSMLGYEYTWGRSSLGKDYKKAVDYLTKAIEKGDNSHTTYLCLGFCYEKGGDGLNKNLNKALEIYSNVPDNSFLFNQLLGEYGYTFSMPLRQAFLYYLEPEVRDYKKAFAMFNKFLDNKSTYDALKESGMIELIYRFLSTCYRFERGTARNEAKADFYLEKSDKIGKLGIDINKILDSLEFGTMYKYLEKDPEQIDFDPNLIYD